MPEATDVKEPQEVKQDLSEEEVAEHAGRYIKEGRDILLSWPEFQKAASEAYLQSERNRISDVRLEKAGKWFEVDADYKSLDISIADNREALEEGGWAKAGGRKKRVHSRRVIINYDEGPFRRDEPYGSISYEGPELTIPTQGRTLPTNTLAVARQIQRTLSELKSL